MANTSLTTASIVLALHLLLSAAMEAATKPQLPTTGICKSLVEIQGYACQEHNVTTKDGYVLGLQRIPMGRSANNKRRLVLLQHGLLVNAASWLVGFPNASLAFILVDNGFDVWLSNNRGTEAIDTYHLVIKIRLSGSGHGLNWLTRIFQLYSSMCKIKRGKTCIMQVIPW